MKSIHLTWKFCPPGLIDGATLRPETLARLDESKLVRRPIQVGSRRHELGDLFHIDVRESRDASLRVDGSNRWIRLGAGMSGGTLQIDGSGGSLIAAYMLGGELRVSGDVGNLAGAGMRGGLLAIEGDAGDQLGGPLPGDTRGMSGGEIIVRGNAGEWAGHRLRRGLIAIGGSTGPHAGQGLIAGTMVVRRSPLIAPGIGMSRGSILMLDPSAIAPRFFRPNGSTQPSYWRLLCRRLLDLDYPIPEEWIDLRFLSFSGDHGSLGRGEILIRLRGT